MVPTYRTKQTQNKRTDIHGSSGIWTHNPSVREGEDGSCLGPRDHFDRPHNCIYINQKEPGLRFSVEARGPFLLQIDYGTLTVSDPIGVGAISQSLKRPGHEAYHSSLSMAGIKNTWSYTATFPYVFTVWFLIIRRDKSIFTFTLYFIFTSYLSL
jgi:hypothetical protein